MRARHIFSIILLILLVIIIACGKKNEKGVKTPVQEQTAIVDDQMSNGGILEVQFGSHVIKDDYLVAQFTARSEVFKIDNLQIYNYEVNSEKYPQFLISIDYMESNLLGWAGKTYPLNFCSLVLNEDSVPFRSEGEVQIVEITEDTCIGKFEGYLINIISNEKTKIQGSFQAKIKFNA